MKQFLLNIRYFLEYLVILIPYRLTSLLPLGSSRAFARVVAWFAWCFPPTRKLLCANIRTVFPEMPEKEVRKIAQKSLFHTFFNMLEFLWIDGRPERIRKRYFLPEHITAALQGHVARGERIIFVNPHLGSWEASGTMAPFYGNVDMVAVAKKVRNPYINRLLNRHKRENVKGLKIVFSLGAIKSSVKALKDGLGLGFLIDQNTRVRDGGEWLDFFGLPCPGSVAPAMLKRYADAHGIPAVIIYGTSIRTPDGKITACFDYLPKPFADYADDREVVNDLMKITERYIRKYPEQYLWLYRRFQYIPPDAPPELRAKYPYYAIVPPETFFRKKERRHFDAF